MASKDASHGDGHFSFATIAVMPVTTKCHSELEDSDSAHPVETSTYSATFDVDPSIPASHSFAINGERAPFDLVGDGLGSAMHNISLHKDDEASGSLPDHQANSLLNRQNSFDDVRTHISNNSSTKMTNFDTKSLASVTTFAMDEKDSVRPDDSASVQAIDEEESLSGRASGTPNSVTGSEAYRDDFRDGNPLRSHGVLPVPGSLFNGVGQMGPVTIPPDSVSNNFIITVNSGNPPEGHLMHGFPLDPDEKLLEAMKSPKDRLLILQLEEKIRYFIENSNETSLELPPSNAFGRLLAHKLGDYYHLTHFVDNNVTSVRLHRTPFCRLPSPISIASNTSPPPSIPAMKIMRRTTRERRQEGSITASSSAASKAASETGDSGQDEDQADSSADTTPAKDRSTLSREEREAKYQEARERIFRDFSDNSHVASGESSAAMSRSSSTTGRKKHAMWKEPKQRTPHDDSFEARSQFCSWQPGVQYGNGGNPQYKSVNDPSYPTPVPYLVGPGVAPPANGFMTSGQKTAASSGNIGMNVPNFPVTTNQQMTPNGSWQAGNMAHQLQIQQQQLRLQHQMQQQQQIQLQQKQNQLQMQMQQQQSSYTGQSGMTSAQSSAKSSPATTNYAIPYAPQYPQNPTWNHQSYGNYQHTPPQGHQSLNYNQPPNMPYPYGQYHGPSVNHVIHPAGSPAMPGGYSRSHFNPQTRSFVPSGPLMPRISSKGAQYSVAPPFSNVPPNAQGQWTGYLDPSQNRHMDHHTPANQARVPNINNQDSIAKWGTPSHLPPKPPPSEVPSDFDKRLRTGPLQMAMPLSYNGTRISGNNTGPLVVSDTGASKPN